MTQVFKAERDCLAGLGLLASTHLNFDPGVELDGTASQNRGFNVHCLVIDNKDGEVLSLEFNRIHADNNPLQHAEQLGVRAAIDRLHKKRPRPKTTSVEKYYKTSLFYESGKAPSDFLDRGCTLYNTYDPCGMCAVTLLAAYMKRIAYLFEDEKFKPVYDYMKTYFQGRESVKEPLSLLTQNRDSPLGEASNLIGNLRNDVENREATIPLVMSLNKHRDKLESAFNLLAAIEPNHLLSQDPRNLRTLADLKSKCNIRTTVTTTTAPSPPST